MQNIYQLGTLASLIFIMAQAYYARRSILQSSEWEKAKITIENIERFKENMTGSTISKIERLGDKLWPDFSNPEKWELSDTLRVAYFSLFDSGTEAIYELIRTLEIMDDFAYPIIMGYASEIGSFRTSFRQYYPYSNFIMPHAFRVYKDLGVHAKLLYRLWRIRAEIIIIDRILPIYDNDVHDEFIEERDKLLCYEGTDITEASLKKYRKKLEKKLKEMQKEIEVFRKNSLK